MERAVDTLKHDDFSSSAVSLLLPQNLQSKAAFAEKADEKTKAAEGATVGAGSGAVLGGALGRVAGMGAIVIPGIGPFLAVGPVFATFLGVGTRVAVGGFLGTLLGIGIPEHDARRYEGRIGKGGSLLAVQCRNEDEVERARRILASTGAEDISSSYGNAQTDVSAA